MMLKPLLASLILSATPIAATAQTPSAGEWTVSGGDTGCIAYAASRNGTVMSILAGEGQEALLFLIQNRAWSSLEDGARYQLALEFDDRNQYKFEALARTELDSDGPGLIFAVPPGQQEGARFIAEFAAANGLDVDQDGERLERLSLSGGQTAMAALAQCMSQMWSGGAAAAAQPAAPVMSVSGKSVKL